MNIQTYSHPDFKHRFMITEESLHFDNSKRWIMQQLDEKGTVVPREITLNKADYEKMVEQLNQQGWKQLLQE